MSNYQQFYDRMTRRLRSNPKLVLLINLLNNSITRIIYVLYPIMLMVGWLRFYQFNKVISGAFLTILPYVVIPGLSFISLSYLRQKLNSPRPYESWAIETLIAKDTLGNSMPSRHVFSATIIGMCALHIYFPLGILLLFMALCLAFLRVIGGVHYPQDVILGLVLGLVAGSLLWLF